MRRLGHVLDAAHQAGHGLAVEDEMSAGDHRLDTRAAQTVDGECRDLLGYPGLERHVTRTVDRVGRGLESVAHHGVVDLGRVDPRPLEQGAGRVRPEVDRGDLGERAVVFGHRGPYPVDQDQITDVHQRIASLPPPPTCENAGASD